MFKQPTVAPAKIVRPSEAAKPKSFQNGRTEPKRVDSIRFTKLPPRAITSKSFSQIQVKPIFDRQKNKPQPSQAQPKRHNQQHSGNKPKPSNQQPRPSQTKPKASVKIETSAPAKDSLRIIPLGGNEEVGRNMTIFEYAGDIVILDMGMMFPEEDMPGIDYIIPNINYLKGREKDVRGVVLSHGHLDHIGAAPILLKQLGNPPVIGRDMTLAMVKKKMEDFEKGSAETMKTMRIGSVSDKITLGKFQIEFFEIEHSIMDAVGVIIKTPHGTVIHPGDWTMEKDPSGKSLVDYTELSKLPSPRILMLESLGATNTNPNPTTEQEMYYNLDKLVSEATGKIIIGTFSSQIRRIGHILEYTPKRSARKWRWTATA